MAWVLLDDHFNDHPKAVEAGPIACWLFCCGLMYCRRHHTNGFIPHAAVSTLGLQVKTQQSATKLVIARLWDAVDGGYRVHGYLELYDDVDAKAAAEARRQQKREAGKKGGQASWAVRQHGEGVGALKQSASKQNEADAKQPALNGAEAHREGQGGEGSSEVLLLGEKSEEGMVAPGAPLDVWLEQLQEDYPQNRVTYGHMTSQFFVDAFRLDPRPARIVWAEMRANLENQKAGHEWRVKGFAPKLEKWLRDGLWKQRHEALPTSELITEKTSRTLSAAAAVKRMGSR